MEGFGDGFIVNVHMRYGSSNVIFNASIYDDESMQKNIQGFDSQIVKLLNVYFEAIIFLFTKWMERETTRENVNNSTTGSKGEKYFIKPVIHVN